MKTREQIAKELKISRKTLYNYLDELNIKDLNDSNFDILKKYVNEKKKSNDVSKSALLKSIEELKLKNAELMKQNETLEEGQKVLLQQVEYMKNSIDTEIRDIKNSITLLLPSPKEQKQGFFRRFFN